MEYLRSKFSENDIYLIREYQKYGNSGFLLTTIGDKSFVVPYKYVRGSRTSEGAITHFRHDLLDFEATEKEKYLQAGEVPLELDYGDETYVVPYDMRDKSFSIESFMEYVTEQCLKKYNTVINAHKELSALGIETMPAFFSGAAAAKYLYKLQKYHKTKDVVAEKSEEKGASSKVKNIDKKALKEKNEGLKKHLDKKYKTALMSVAIAGSGVLGAGFLMAQQNEPENEQKVQVENVQKEELKIYTDYLGNEYSDEFGNLARLKALKPEIMMVIYAIEGYAEKAFCDGYVKKDKKTTRKNARKISKKGAEGTATVGSGFTVLYDENGNKRSVHKGDTVSLEEDAVYNSRYIDMELVPLLGDEVGRELSNEEILCSIGLGYCWGTEGFKNSEFYKSLRNKDCIEVLGRKTSGWRTPIGILKRAYLCEQVLKGHWTAQDLLDMPVYSYGDKGFVGCGIYTLDFRWYMPCQKDRKGNFVKDKRGNDVPKVMKDDFCAKFYDDSDKKILGMLKNMALRGTVSYKTVRDFMTEDLLAEMNERDKDKDKNLAFGEWPLVAQWQSDKGGR